MTLRHVDFAGEAAALGRDGFFVRDGFFGLQLAREVRAQAEVTPLRRAGIRRAAQIDDAVRSDEIAFLTSDQASGALATAVGCFTELMDVLNREAFVGLRSFDLQLARYGPGAKYVRHRDAFPGQGNRRVTAIVYLNEGWVPAHGGELKLFEPDTVIAPVMDRLVVFLSEKIEHEVLESRAERFALTAWYVPSP